MPGGWRGSMISERHGVPDCWVCSRGGAEHLLSLPDHLGDQVFDLNRCLHCGFLQLGNPPSAEALPRFYENSGGSAMRSSGSGLFKALRSFALRLEVRGLTARIPKGSVIADLGAGDGSMVELLSSMGFRTLAVDAYGQASWTLSSIEYRQLELHGNSFRAESLLVDGRAPDVVIMRHSLEHVLYPRLLLESFAKIGVKYLWIIVPNSESFFSRIFGRFWYYWDPPRHLSFFTWSSLRKITAESGYSKVLFFRYFGIDEFVTSIYRFLQLRAGSRLPRGMIEFFSPKGPVAALSSCLAAISRNRTALGVLISRGDTDN